MNPLFPPKQGSMVSGKVAYLSDVQKWKKRHLNLVLARFGPPSNFEPILNLEYNDLKKRALAAHSCNKQTLIVQSLH